MISRYIFDETMYRLCYSETFNVCFFRSAGRLSNRSGAAAISFGGCLVFHFRYSVVDSAMRAEYSIAYRTLVRQLLLDYCDRQGTIVSSSCHGVRSLILIFSVLSLLAANSWKNFTDKSKVVHKNYPLLVEIWHLGNMFEINASTVFLSISPCERRIFI